MANTIKLKLRKSKKNKHGQIPIYLYINTGGEPALISTGYYILPSQWDQKSEQVKDNHPFHESINLDITNKKKNALSQNVQALVNNQTLSSHKVRQKVRGEFGNIFQFLDTHKTNLRNKRTAGTFENWDNHLKRLEAFHGSKDLTFDQITPDFLLNFEHHLREGNGESVKVKNSYIVAIMATLRSLFLEAREKKLTDNYPFSDYEQPESNSNGKDHLNEDELLLWEQAVREMPPGGKRLTGAWFLFGCYSGLRVSDWITFDFKKRLHKDYLNAQAKKNGQWVALPYYGPLLRAIELIDGEAVPYQVWHINRVVKEIARDLKINKHLSSHCARKTFAVTVCLGRGISSETGAELMGITLNTFVNSYSKVTPAKIRKEVLAAWGGL